MRMVVLLSILGFSTMIFAAAPNANAPQGGNFNFNLGVWGEPPTIHPITASDYSSFVIQSYVSDTLLVHDPETYEYKPRLAEKWEISKDQKTFTFFLRKNSFFHDGKPVTAEDIKFSFDAIFEAKYKAAHLRPYFENISKVEIVDPYTVRFLVKTPYFLNFDCVSSLLLIIPKHIYSDVEKSNKMNRTLIGAGPYVLDRFDVGQKIVLKKFDKWYGNNTPEYKGSNNFKTITMRFVKEENVYLEMTKKGDFDFVELNAEQYVKKANGGGWGKTALKFKVENLIGKGYRWVGWNMDNPLFKSRDVRVALAHLMNREDMNKKFRYDLSVLATGPTDTFSDYASPKVKPILFDPKKAGELLAKDGWKDTDQDGVLDKVIDGKKTDFRFSLVHSNKDYEKYWTIYKEDLKKAGIDMELKYLEWNSFNKILDERKFEAVALGWTTGIEFDPKQQWHSSSAVSGGSNFTNYKNAEVDELIEEARQEIDRKKRIPLLRKVYERIAEDAPYVFLFNEKFYYYATSSKVEKPAETFKYSVGSEYWWLRP